MKKDELMKLEGMTEELATKIAEMSANETKDMIPRSRLNEVIAERDNTKKEHILSCYLSCYLRSRAEKQLMKIRKKGIILMILCPDFCACKRN